MIDPLKTELELHRIIDVSLTDLALGLAALNEESGGAEGFEEKLSELIASARFLELRAEVGF